MAARATWKGYLKVSLVNIPIKVFPATESSATISFNQLHGECQTRIQQKRWCPHCEREVPNTELVKGYEFEKGRYVVLDEQDFDKVKTESTRVINLIQFSDEASIDPMYVDRTYYLAPDGGVATDAFAVMREGMKGKVGIGKLALYGREYLVAVRPHENGIVMHTLHHAAEIRGMDAVEELNSVPSKVNPAEVKLAKQVIETFEAPLNLKDYKDEYREGLQEIIDAKIEGKEVRRAGGRSAAEGRQPDGGAEEEPRRGQLEEEGSRESHRRKRQGRRRSQAQARVANDACCVNGGPSTASGRAANRTIAAGTAVLRPGPRSLARRSTGLSRTTSTRGISATGFRYVTDRRSPRSPLHRAACVPQSARTVVASAITARLARPEPVDGPGRAATVIADGHGRR